MAWGEGELAALDLGEAGGVAFVLGLAEDGRVERGRRRGHVAGPVALGGHGGDHGLGVHRLTGLFEHLGGGIEAGHARALLRAAGILLPAYGKYVGASSIAFSEYKRKRGDRIGLHWRIPNTVGKRQVRHALVDTNYWKTFVHARLAVAMGDPGCLSLSGRDEKAHRLLADHLTAEYRVKAMAQGRTVDEWKLRAIRPDNHWLDCLVGCAVAASIQGVALSGVESDIRQARPRLKLSELQRSR